MYNWTLQSLWRERKGLSGNVAALAAAFLLVMIFEGIFRGESEQIVSYIKYTDADVWVMQTGVGNMHMASSYVWDWKQAQVAHVEGVAAVAPILYLNAVIHIGGQETFAYVVGIKPESYTGGPWAMASGRNTLGKDDIIIPKTLAQLRGIQIGDVVRIAEKTLHVSGLSEGTYSMANSVGFVDYDTLADILGAQGTLSYLLVKAQPGVDSNSLAMRIETQVDKVTALPRATFLQNDFTLAMQMGVEIISIMSLICTLLAMLIAGFTAYTRIMHKRRELAVAKALGVTNRAVYLSVLLQSFLITIFSLILAVLAAYLLLPVLSAVVPYVTLSITFADMLPVIIAALLVAAGAAIIPAYMVARIDPMTVFRR